MPETPGAADQILLVGLVLLAGSLAPLGSAITLVPWLWRRPDRTRPWAWRRASERVAGLAHTVAELGQPRPDDRIVRYEAFRLQVGRRASLLVMPAFVMMMAGFVLCVVGLFTGAGPWRVGGATPPWPLGLAVRGLIVIGWVVAELSVLGRVQARIFNRLGYLFAAADLLRLVELTVLMRDRVTRDPYELRREACLQLGDVADRLRRVQARELAASTRGEVRAEVTERAEQLASVVRRQQIVLTEAPHEQVEAMAPVFARALVAVVEDRLPAVGPILAGLATTAAARIFLCYSRDDWEAVSSLYARLAQANLTPWYDMEDLRAGQDWKSECEKAIRSSDVFVACLSTYAVTNPGYVHKELKLAVKVAEQQPEGKVYIVPVRLDDCGVPPSLERLHWVDLFRAGGTERLLRDLREHSSS